MQCDQCGARRPRTGACPNCGAPPPGTFSSMRSWRSQDPGAAASRRRGSGAGWEDAGGRRGSGAGWDAQDWDAAPARSGRRNPRGDYEDEVDLGRALVPLPEQMPMAPGSAGMPAIPGLAASDEAERALGVRRPVYIPATQDRKVKVRHGSWRVMSGVLSVLLFCTASCGLAGFLGRSKIESFLAGPIKVHLTPPAFDYSIVPPTPTATPGPDGKFITNVVTARGEDSLHNPVGPTTHFTVEQSIHLLGQVRGVPKGQKHSVWVRWYLNGVDLGWGRVPGKTVASVTQGDTNLFFVITYPQPGIGMARLYWDIPNSDTGDSPNDQYLAQTVVFGIWNATPTPGVSPTATPTKSADVGTAPVARRETNTSALA
jgi:hypothetical protein